MQKINGKKTVVLTFSALIFAVIALLVFMLLPTSELANGISYSAKSAIYVLAVSPVASLISFGLYMLALIKGYNSWCDAFSKPCVNGLAALFAVFAVFNLAVFSAYFFLQVSLGFVAPYGGTVYEYLAIVAMFATVNFTLLTVFSSIAVKRIKNQ